MKILPFSETFYCQIRHWESSCNVHGFLKEIRLCHNYEILRLAESGETQHSDETQSEARYCNTRSRNVEASRTTKFHNRISCLASCFDEISLFVSLGKISCIPLWLCFLKAWLWYRNQRGSHLALSLNGGQVIWHYLSTLHGCRRPNLSCILFKLHHGYFFDIFVEKMWAKFVFDEVNLNFNIGGSYVIADFLNDFTVTNVTLGSFLRRYVAPTFLILLYQFCHNSLKWD
jgi:hypothetical protein